MCLIMPEIEFIKNMKFEKSLKTYGFPAFFNVEKCIR